jgi:predicted phosphodiesterase
LAQFSYIHLSDTHLCIQPGRRNVQQLIQRNVRNALDTAVEQTQTLGFASILRPASYVPEIVAGAAQFCFERAQIVDGLIFTGDLATTGTGTDIAIAHTFVSAPATAGFYSAPRTPTLAFLGSEIHVVPGNHDKFADEKGTPNSRNFELRFDTYMPNFSSGVGHWVVEKQSHHLGFIIADLTLQSRADADDRLVGVFGQGRVYKVVLDELTKRTLHLRSQFSDISLVWVIHFAPFECGYRLRLVDFDEIVDAAVRLRIVATLCGHTHKSSKTVIDNHVIYCGGSAGCVDSDRDARIHVLKFDVGTDCRVRRENFVWDRAQHEFVHHSDD